MLNLSVQHQIFTRHAGDLDLTSIQHQYTQTPEHNKYWYLPNFPIFV